MPRGRSSRLGLYLMWLSWHCGTVAYMDGYWSAHPGRQAPKFWPEGGRFTTSVAVTIDCPTAGSTVHYKTCWEYDMTMPPGSTRVKGIYQSASDCNFPEALSDVRLLSALPSGKSLVLGERDNVLRARCVLPDATAFENLSQKMQVVAGT